MTMAAAATNSVRPPHWKHNRKYFFKYVSGPTGRIILTNRTLRWSVPKLLNDPYDIQFDLRTDIDRSAVKSAALEKLWNNHYGEYPATAKNELGVIVSAFRGVFPRLSREKFDAEFGESIDQGFEDAEKSLPDRHRKIREYMSDSKILCLSGRPDSILMWSHYAERHTGLVLRLRSAVTLDSAWGAAEPVRYMHKMPLLFDEEFLSDLLSGSTAMDMPYVHQKVHDMVYTKASCWSYEKEWRVFAGGGRARTDYEDLSFNPFELSGVIFGCGMPVSDRKEFTDLVRSDYPNAAIHEVKKVDREFRLMITPA
ncbi:MAG TPA: DUF2971 domain-containing protein [Acetobacteraceae bacterium]|jgi:hypothetical protein